jgi:hypothetical protein
MKADFGNETCRPGVKSGEMTIREIIAFQLDHENFSSVPKTSFVEVNHPKFNSKYETPLHESIQGQLKSISAHESKTWVPNTPNSVQNGGSLQEFVKSEGPIENFSDELFSADEVHKIAVLDLRLMSLDRNSCNILV